MTDRSVGASKQFWSTVESQEVYVHADGGDFPRPRHQWDRFGLRSG